MITLDATTKSLEIDLTGAVTTNQLPFVACYVDISQSTFAMSAVAEQDGTSNNTTAVTCLSAPGASTSRVLKFFSWKNSDTAAVEGWLQLNNNGTLREIWKGTLQVGDTLFLVDAANYHVLNASGSIKTSAGISAIGSSTDNAFTRWDGTGGSAIQNSSATLDDNGRPTFPTTVGVGNATPSTSGSGISFPATQSASTDANTLDDYEEGTWTPIDASGAGLSFTNNEGSYEKIGRQFRAGFVLTYPATADVSNAIIGGLPFTVSNNSYARQAQLSSSDEATFVGLISNNGATTCSPRNNLQQQLTNATMSGNNCFASVITQV